MTEETKPIKVFVYGILKGRGGKPAILEGYKMYSLGMFPAILPGNGIIHGEILEIDQATLVFFDQIEGFNGPNHRYNHYNRIAVETIDKEVVWIYVYNRDISNEYPEIRSGNWLGGMGLNNA